MIHTHTHTTRYTRFIRLREYIIILYRSAIVGYKYQTIARKLLIIIRLNTQTIK